MWKRLTASNLEDGIATSIYTAKWKRKRKRWKRHENRPLPHPYLSQYINSPCPLSSPPLPTLITAIAHPQAILFGLVFSLVFPLSSVFQVRRARRGARDRKDYKELLELLVSLVIKERKDRVDLAEYQGFPDFPGQREIMDPKGPQVLTKMAKYQSDWILEEI